MGYVYNINGPVFIVVYLALQLLALSLSLDYKTLKIKENVIFGLHPLHLQPSSFTNMKGLEVEVKRESS